ncbi:MAG: MBL fold metallo-hydrolase, partial [Deltaproteobacteria bacterium]
KDPHEIFDADYLFVESTYGDRKHKSFDDSKAELLEAINYSYSHGEKIIIPALAVERTQEILYILGELDRAGKLPNIPIYLDSPLAIKATEIFRKNKKCYDQEAQAIVEEGYDPFDMPNLRFTLTTQESMEINELQGSAIVIAANGMCTAGRIKHHLKHNLWREGASLVIVGYQAAGTTGRKIVEGAKRVKIFRENVAVNAKVFTIGGFSAHADQEDLLQWISHFESRPEVFVVHGEPASSQALASLIEQRFKLKVHIPRWKERLVLKPREIGVEAHGGQEALPDIQTMMFNAVVDLEKQIKKLKKLIMSKQWLEKAGEEEVDKLQYLNEELREMLG